MHIRGIQWLNCIHWFKKMFIGKFKKKKSFQKVTNFLIFFFWFFSWGRWDEILAHCGLRKGYTAQSVEDAFRLALLYCVNTYRGDEKLKTFCWELITPPGHAATSNSSNEGSKKDSKSRKSKSRKSENNGELEGIEWIADEKYDMEVHLEKNYRKHLDRHNNKILLRIKMLHYIQHDICGQYADKLKNPNRPLA